LFSFFSCSSSSSSSAFGFEDENEDDNESDCRGNQGQRPLVSPLCTTLREFCSRFGSHGQRLVLAVGFSLRSTTHDHRGQRGDRGYPCGDIKGGSPWLVSRGGNPAIPWIVLTAALDWIPA
jgi:hypothetical protein